MGDKRSLNESEASEYVGLAKSTLRNVRSNGFRPKHLPPPPFLKVGRAIRYLKDDLDKWLESFRREVRGMEADNV